MSLESQRTILSDRFNAEPISFSTEDDVMLHGTVYSPAATPRASVLLNNATGAPASFYEPFAQWLCEERQLRVFLYDYRDFGKSSTGHPRKSNATMADWGVKDQAAALRYILGRETGLPVWVIGHSLGGLCLPFLDDARHVDRLIAVASGPAYLLKHPPIFIPLALYFWWVIGPTSTMLNGYLPGRSIGMGADLPKGVFWQWRRWCLSPEFYKADWGNEMPEPDFKRFRGEIYLVAVADDFSVPPQVVAELGNYYPDAKNKNYTVLNPSDHGLRSIGHIGAFSRKNKAVWPTIIPD